MNLFFVGDWHIGETRMEILGRPFVTGDECVEAMIRLHNKMVKPDDLVIVVGDVCHTKSPESLPLVAKFNGRKILVRGNHDRIFSDSDLQPYFEKVVEDGGSLGVKVAGMSCRCVHYPTQGSPDKFNIVGHIHGAWKVQLNMLNVGVDAHHFRPVPEDKVAFYFRAISEFYDEDVWVAYRNCNEIWKGRRGKKGSYLDDVRPSKA